MPVEDCIFCKIVAGQVPSFKIFENKACLAFMDVGPLSDGHLLVVPTKHYEQITQMPPDEVAAIAQQLPALGKAVVEATAAEGFNVLQNNGSCSGQVVMHVHFHIIGRREGDGLGYRWLAKRYPEGKAERLQQAILQALGN